MLTLRGKQMMKIQKTPTDGVLRRWRPAERQSQKLQAYRSYAIAHRYVQERCRHFRRG